MNDAPTTEDRAPDAAPRWTGRHIAAATMLALALALAASWAFVLRPAAADRTIGVDDLVNSDVRDADSPDEIATVGRPAPDVRLKGFDGADVTIESLQGKPTLVNFWASSCAPCIQEMPLLEAGYQELGAEVNFVGVDVFEAPELGREMIARTGVTFPQTVDPTNEVLARFGGTQLPHTVIIAADGTIAALHNQPITTEAELRGLINAAG